MTDWEHEARSLSTQVKQCHERIAAIEQERNEARLELSKERLHVTSLRNDMAAIKNHWRVDVETLRGAVVPHGDMHDGYFCDCGTEIDYPEEQRYCSWCGAQLDWHAQPSTDDDWAYEHYRDEQLAPMAG